MAEAGASFGGNEALRRVAEHLSKLQTAERHVPKVEAPPDLSVAVIVPTYNDCKFLGPALRSVANQTCSQWRCYIVDDGGQQAVERVVNRFSRDDRFVLLRHGINAGVGAARNTGARIAREPVLQFLDADDLLVPWALEKRLEVLRDGWADPFLAGVYGEIVPCEETAQKAPVRERTKAKPIDDTDWLSSEGACPFELQGCLIRRSVFVGVGGFNEEFDESLQEWEFWQRVLRHGHVVRAAPHIVGAQRQRSRRIARAVSRASIERAADLLARANQPAVLRIDAPMPYPMALGALRADYSRTKLAATYAGMNFAKTTSLQKAVTSVASVIDGAVVIPTRGPEFAESVRNGIYRGLGLGQSETSLVHESAAAALENAAAEVSIELIARGERSTRCEPPETDMAHLASCDIALIAEHAGDVNILEQVAVAAEIDGLTAVALDIECVGGAQGASDRWRALGRQLVPYNAFCLGALSVRAVVGRRPGGPTTWSTLGSVAANSGMAFVVNQDNDGIVIAGSPPSRELMGVKAALPTEISSIVASAPFWSMPGPHFESDEPARHDPRRSQVRLGSEFVTLLPSEESRLHDKSMRTLRELRNAHAGETGVVIGNGPSLNETDLTALKGVATFGVNSIFLAGDRLPEPLTYYVVEDSVVMRENAEDIKAYKAHQKLFPTNYLPYFENEPIPENTTFFRMNNGFYNRKTGTYCLPRFSTDASQRLFCGQSVTIINLQLAYWMGFEQVILIGMDFSYKIPEDAEVNDGLILSRSADPNHFHPDYFGAGKTWKPPQLDRVLANYRLAKQVFEADGRRIINATVGGALEEFERSTLAALLR